MLEPRDTTPPVVVCPAIQSPIFAHPGAREAVVTYPDAQASDVSGIDTSRYNNNISVIQQSLA